MEEKWKETRGSGNAREIGIIGNILRFVLVECLGRSQWVNQDITVHVTLLI